MDTAGTLADYYHSTTMEDFKKGMISKTSTFKELDMKMIGMIAVVGVGVFFGLFLLMNGGH